MARCRTINVDRSDLAVYEDDRVSESAEKEGIHIGAWEKEWIKAKTSNLVLLSAHHLLDLSQPILYKQDYQRVVVDQKLSLSTLRAR